MLESNGMIGDWVDTLMGSVQTLVLQYIPTMVDYLWAFAFVTFVFNLLRAAYFAKRESYSSVLAFLTFGIMIIFFIMGIFIQLSEWVQNVFLALVLPTLSYATPFFSLYLENIGLVNTVIIVIAVILNFVDFEFGKFDNQKTDIAGGNEIV
jgi:hypothetical protein